MTDSILSEINTSLVLNLLYFEWNENGQAFGGQRTESTDFTGTDRQDRIEAVHLLIFEHRHLTHVLTGSSLNGFRVQIQLLLGICRDDHRDDRKEHTLISGGQVVQHILCFSTLKVHIIRNRCGEVVVLVLLSLPVGNVRLDTEQTVLNLTDRLVGRHRNDIDGEHHVAIHIRQFGYHGVLDIGRIILKIKDSGITLAKLDEVAVLFHTVGADIIPIVVAELGVMLQIECEAAVISVTVEVMQYVQLFSGIKRFEMRSQRNKVLVQFCLHAVEVHTRLFDVFLVDGNRNVLFLHESVCSCRLGKEHIVVFLSVLVQAVILHRHEDRLFKVRLLHAVIVDRDLGSRARIQTVQKICICQEHAFLVLPACHHIVDVCELEGLGKLVADLEDSIQPQALDGNRVLHLAGRTVLFLVLFEDGAD